MRRIIPIAAIAILAICSSFESKHFRRGNDPFKRNHPWEVIKRHVVRSRNADESLLETLMRLSRQQNVYPCPGESWDIVACQCPDGSWGPYTVLPWAEDPCTPDERPGTCMCSDNSTMVDMIEFSNNFVPMHYPPA